MADGAGTPEDTPVTGRCLCGAVRYAYRGKPSWQKLCHCESCRRACGAPIAAFLSVPMTQFRWTSGAPHSYLSSPGAERGFCGTCGSPLYYAPVQPDGTKTEIHILAASLDDPTKYTPEAHDFWPEHLDWLHLSDHLPRTE